VRHKSLLIFVTTVVLALLLFLALERGFSPSFKACINHEGQKTAEVPDSGLSAMVDSYVHCSWAAINDNQGGITALATLAIAAFTATLWFATNQQAELTKEAFIADKRAFVFATGFTSIWEEDKATSLYNWRFKPTLRNSGETPTKTLQMYVACEVRNTSLPPGYAFTPQEQYIASGMMPPKFDLQGGQAPQFPGAAVTPQDIVDAQAGRKFIYLWGWIKYRDVFPKTPQHTTRYCWAILPTGDPMTFVPNTPGQPPAPGTLSFHSIHLPDGNSIDDANS
jgi:hypothetical protein